MRRDEARERTKSQREIREDSGRREDEGSSETPEDQRRPSLAECFFGKAIPDRQSPNERNNNEQPGRFTLFNFHPAARFIAREYGEAFLWGQSLRNICGPSTATHSHIRMQTRMPARPGILRIYIGVQFNSSRV